ncbi:GntR family transcriptional regulator [uncultured Hoeflea sp.]|uniref:GntR family transcriptional regulator n=1 Tax=uncultured Hoeflea sp. TaxID=538666 RepID=UPI00261A98B8|nr:GntR family transcriptional regulator [uncultured Hoeflea sp.]
MSNAIIDVQPVRVYEQTRQKILEMIELRDYLPGDRIPSERELSERFGVHRMTLRKAIDELVSSGILERRGTSGTFLPAPVVKRPVAGLSPPYSISEIVRSCGGVPGSRLLLFEQRDANQRVAERLQIEKGAPVVAIKRLRTVSDLPFCIETSCLPVGLVRGLAADDLVGDVSLYTLLHDRYSIVTESTNAIIGVVPTQLHDAELLGLKRGEAALVIHVIASDARSKPIEYMTSINHPRRVMLTTERIIK